MDLPTTLDLLVFMRMGKIKTILIILMKITRDMCLSLESGGDSEEYFLLNVNYISHESTSICFQVGSFQDI
jgi:hypothetical protein